MKIKGFTDEQIIIALESSKEAAETDEVRDFLDDVIECINRQAAEIERMNVELKAMRGAANSYRLELERKEDELHRAKVEISKHFDYVDEAADEAIKEFADRLKSRLRFYYQNQGMLEKEFCLLHIDKAVKEMTEENE